MNYLKNLLKNILLKHVIIQLNQYHQLSMIKNEYYILNHIFQQSKFRLKFIKKPETQQYVRIDLICYKYNDKTLYCKLYK